MGAPVFRAKGVKQAEPVAGPPSSGVQSGRPSRAPHDRTRAPTAPKSLSPRRRHSCSAQNREGCARAGAAVRHQGHRARGRHLREPRGRRGRSRGRRTGGGGGAGRGAFAPLPPILGRRVLVGAHRFDLARRHSVGDQARRRPFRPLRPCLEPLASRSPPPWRPPRLFYWRAKSAR